MKKKLKKECNKTLELFKNPIDLRISKSLFITFLKLAKVFQASKIIYT